MGSGYYGFCCLCYNEKTKSVPLDKITDLRLEQGCVQKCFDVQGIAVETASSSAEKSEISLIGLYKPQEVRMMILRVRDNNGINGVAGTVNGSTGNPNPLLPPPTLNTKELEQLVEQQTETMVEIKDVLVDMKNALISMNEKMIDKQ